MKIYFLKRAALEYLKANLKTLYTNYYQRDDNEWIAEAFGEEPFEFFAEVPDFELAALDERPAGEIDFDNCKIIYENLKMLSESQASDERLWAGLCNGVFYKYMRRRWNYNVLELDDPEKNYGAILSRFFFSGGVRSGIYRNTLSKSWWVGRATYNKSANNHFEALDIIGKNDISSKISDIFYSNNFAANPSILMGIIDALKYFNDREIKLQHKEVLRPAIQYLNAVGGATLLDVLSKEEIEQILRNKIIELLQGREGAIVSSDTDEDKDFNDDEVVEIVAEDEQPSVVEFENPEDEQEEETLKRPDYITYGCAVIVLRERDNQELTYHIPLKSDKSRNLYKIEVDMLGKGVGFRQYLSGSWYKVIDFDWDDEE